MHRKDVDMLRGPLLPSIVSYTVPIILTGLLQLLFNAADMVVVGQYCGSVSLAAVGSTGALTSLIVNLFIGLSTGTGVTVAHALGCGQNDMVHRTVHTALPLSLVSGAILTVVGISYSRSFLAMMDTPINVLPLSATYMEIYFAGITFSMVYNFCASILRAAGDTKSPLVFLLYSGVLNVVLNVIFVTLLDMNVAGVAWATVISQAVSAALVVLALMRRTDACRLDLRKIRIYKEQLFKIVRIGLPAGIQSSLFSISNVLIQSSVNSFQEVAMSGNAAASNIESFVYVCINSFYQTSTNFVGQNMGAGQYQRVKSIVKQCVVCVTIVGISLSALVYLFGEPLLSIYITDSPDAIQYGMTRLLYFIPYFLCGIMEVSTGALRGMSISLSPLIISVLGVCAFRIAWIHTIFQIPQFHSLECLYLSYTVSWIITLTSQLIVFMVAYRKRTQKAMAQEA